MTNLQFTFHQMMNMNNAKYTTAYAVDKMAKTMQALKNKSKKNQTNKQKSSQG